MSISKEIIGSYAAKTHFSEILDHVSKEKKEYVVTKRGKPVAIISPYIQDDYKDVKKSVERFIKYSDKRNLSLGEDIKEIKHKGHKF